MARRIESLSLAGPAGRLEALLEEPDDQEPRLAALVCHPHPLYGGTMHNKVVYRIARGLRRAGCVVLRFNFRGVGQSAGEHGYMAGEIEDARAPRRGEYGKIRKVEKVGLSGVCVLDLRAMACGTPRARVAARHLPSPVRGERGPRTGRHTQPKRRADSRLDNS